LFDSSPLNLLFVVFPLSILAGGMKKLGIKSLKKYFPAPVRFLWDADALIDVAGVSFIDKRLKFLPFNVLSVYPSFLLGVPVFKISQASGPFQRFLNRLLAKHTIGKCQHFFARGKTTLKHIHELGISREKYSLAPDIVFCNESGDSITSNSLEFHAFLNKLKLEVNGKIKIGICPSSVIAKMGPSNKKDYMTLVKDVIVRLLKDGYCIVLFPNATKEHKPGVWRNNDIPLVNEIVHELNMYGQEQSFLYYNKNVNTDGVKSIIQELDCCIVSRFHAMIYALTLKKPVFILGWSHKYHEVMEQFALEEYVMDCHAMEPEAVMVKIREMVNKGDNIKLEIERHLDLTKQYSYNQIKLIASAIE
jgi:polysaccharide pyruvyl transferase WcaK-like protein